MKLTATPTRFEAIDEADDLVFVVECFDFHTSQITIKQTLGPLMWETVSAEIAKCLDAIHPKEDEKPEGPNNEPI